MVYNNNPKGKPVTAQAPVAIIKIFASCFKACQKPVLNKCAMQVNDTAWALPPNKNLPGGLPQLILKGSGNSNF